MLFYIFKYKQNHAFSSILVFGGRHEQLNPLLSVAEALGEDIPELRFWTLIGFLKNIEYFDTGLTYEAMYCGIEARSEALKKALTLSIPNHSRSRYFTVIPEAAFWLGKISEAENYISKALGCSEIVPQASLIWSKILELSGHWAEAYQVIHEANSKFNSSEHIAWEARILYVHRKRDSIRSGRAISAVMRDARNLLEYALEQCLVESEGMTLREQNLRGEINYQYACMLQEQADREPHESQSRFNTFELALNRLREARQSISPIKHAECDLMIAQCLVELARVKLKSDQVAFKEFAEQALTRLYKYATEHVDENTGKTTYELDNRMLMGTLAGQSVRFATSLFGDGSVAADNAIGIQSVSGHMIEIMDSQDIREIERETPDMMRG